MRTIFLLLPLTLIIGLLSFGQKSREQKPELLRVLILDGRNNHDWRGTTEALQAILERTGRFEVEVESAPESGLLRAPRLPRDAGEETKRRFAEAQKRHRALRASLEEQEKTKWSEWEIDFSKYDAVLVNYNGPDWPEKIREGFVAYVRDGGGVMMVHAANNPFTHWKEYNEMIGFGWRNEKFGKAISVVDGKLSESAEGKSGHGAKHPFQITVQNDAHPVMKGFPNRWMHGRDELYHRMRGSAEGVTVLSSAWSDPQKGGSGKHEPMIWTKNFGKGRVLVTSLGHFWVGDRQRDSLHCVGFQTVAARGMEFLATGKVTLEIPSEFPTAEQTSILPPHELAWASKPQEVDQTSWKAKKAEDTFAQLNVEESREAMDLAMGYEISAIASEPAVQEPVLTVWDGNGVMYVAEMRSYMQNVEGEGTKTLKNGRVKRFEDEDGDGHYERVTVFIDGLNLPRMLLPLDDRLAVVETDTTSVFSYRDTDGDGISDEKIQLWKGKEIPATKSVEHQDSGLVWNIDNNIYVSYGHTRYRFTDDQWKGSRGEGLWAQWGLDHDETGQIFYSTNSEPFFSSQMPREYWGLIRHRGGKRPRDAEPVAFGKPYDLSFLEMKNLCETDDRGPKNQPRRGMTSAGGQSVYKGGSLPAADLSSFFITDPTAHVVRRGLITDQRGRQFLTHPHGKEEWLVSPDVFFRPVNTTMGPDGAIYISDMARGIIQDAPWLSEGPRKYIRETGMDQVIQRGRIWRVAHQDHPWNGRKPRMLDESTAELIRHLDDRNGWWRMTAQKLIILRKDRDSVVPLLEDMVRFSDRPLARLHALWTLEGIGKNTDVLQSALSDRDWRVRAAAVRMHEPMITAGEAEVVQRISKLAQDRDARVSKQVILSLGWSKDESVFQTIDQAILKHPGDLGVTLAGTVALWGNNTEAIKTIRSGEAFQKLPAAKRTLAATAWTEALAQWDRGLKFGPEISKADRRRIEGGEVQYFQSCVSCHGSDGKGTSLPGTELALAPSLAGSKRVKRHPDELLAVMANGLAGPIDGKTYQVGYMAPAHALGITRDDRLAEIVSYIRYAWGNKAAPISQEEVKAARSRWKDRAQPWTDEELKKLD